MWIQALSQVHGTPYDENGVDVQAQMGFEVGGVQGGNHLVWSVKLL